MYPRSIASHPCVEVLGGVQGAEVYGGIAQRRTDITGYVQGKKGMDMTKGMSEEWRGAVE